MALIGKVVAAIAVVVVVTIVIVATAGAAAAIPALATVTAAGATTLSVGGTVVVGAIGVGTAAAGTKAVYDMAADEYYNANIYSLGEYTRNAFDVTYSVGSLLSLPLNLWSLPYTLPKALESLASLTKFGLDVLFPTINSLVPATGPIGVGAIAIPQVVGIAESIIGVLGIAGAASGAFRPDGKHIKGVRGTGNRREELMNKVKNEKLKSIINQLFREEAIIGDDGSAAALVDEVQKNILKPNGEFPHLQKCINRAKELSKLIKSGDLSAGDAKIAWELLQDLYDAIKYAGGVIDIP